MAPFTPEQEQILEEMKRRMVLLEGVVRELNMRLGVLHALLLRIKHTYTEEEYRKVSESLRARVMVDKVLDPKLRSLQKEVDRFIRGEENVNPAGEETEQ